MPWVDATRCRPKHATVETLPAPTFAPCASPPPLGDDEVHVWQCACADDRPASVAALARQQLERLLRAYTGSVLTPRIERGAQGKPFAPDWPQLAFNLSHTRQYALLAFARGLPLGIDVEREDRRVTPLAIAERHFAAAEAVMLARLPAVACAAAFRQLWTGKEAVLKALGQGLSFGLDRVEFALAPNGRVGALQHLPASVGATEEWTLNHFAPAPGLVAALAWRGGARRLRYLASTTAD